MGYLKYVKKLYQNIRQEAKNPKNQEIRALIAERKKEWRRGSSVVRLEHPTRPDAARRLGYRAKQGIIVARVRVRAGGLHKSRANKARVPRKMGMAKITAEKSIQRIAEERASKNFPNMEALASYWIMEDGKNHWYEVILIDPSHPVIAADKNLSWMTKNENKGRAERGLTPAGKKGRGQMKRGTGTEKNRPSIRAHGRAGK
ncbi:50S ribosomal protein L15e [uncultured archaeon]|nr:50S ribosomal protein L15e [uncultured archaeon]